MNLKVTADHEPDTEARAWLENIYIRRVFDEVVPFVRECAIDVGFGFPEHPWEAYQGLLHVHIHPDASWGTVGLTSPGLIDTGFHRPTSYCKVEISWNYESASWDLDADGYTTDPTIPKRYGGHYPLRHEMQHFLARQAGFGNWHEFGHGTFNDPLIRLRGRQNDFIYHRDVRQRHVRNLGVDL